MSFFYIFASEYRISDPMSPCRNGRNKAVEVLLDSSGPDFVSNQILFSGKLSLDYWNPFYCDAAANFIQKNNFFSFQDIQSDPSFEHSWIVQEKKSICFHGTGVSILSLKKQKRKNKEKRHLRHFNGYILFPLLWVSIIQGGYESVSQNCFEEKSTSWNRWLCNPPHGGIWKEGIAHTDFGQC